MGKLLMQNDREIMKIAILKHEETFKQQVHELHRLYRVQKLMMNDLRAEARRKTDKQPLPDGIAELEKESSNLELTLATGDSRKKRESSVNTDSGASFSSAEFGGHEWGMFQQSSFRSKGKSEFDVEEEVRKEMVMKQSPWLLQCLSFDMTLP